MIIEVKVRPSAKKDAILKFKKPNIFEISLKAKPEKNQANKSLCRFLSKLFKISENNIKIIKGKTSKKKLIQIKNLNEEKFLKKLETSSF